MSYVCKFLKLYQNLKFLLDLSQIISVTGPIFNVNSNGMPMHFCLNKEIFSYHRLDYQILKQLGNSSSIWTN